MRIVFDVTSCAKPQRGGIANYGWELVAACARTAPEHDYVLAVRSQKWLHRRLLAGMLAGARPRLLVDGLHRLLLGAPIDAFHGIGVRLPALGRFPKTVMLHDSNVFEFPELSDRSWRHARQDRIRQTVSRADLVLSYSEQGAAALVEHTGLARERIRVVPLGVDVTRFRRPPKEALHAVLARHGLSERPYAIHVGLPDRRKNQDGLVTAFARAGLPPEWTLALGGPTGAAAEALAAHGRRLGLGSERLRLLGWVADDDLPALVAGAAFAVCASLHEGFGLPVLEAQACGVPVVCSDRGALPETLGGCGLLFDPADEEAFAAALRRMAEDERLRRDLARRGPARVAAEYTWERVAERTLVVLAEASALRASGAGSS